MDGLIAKNQSAFMPGRQILDNIITAKELVHSMKLSKSVVGSFDLKLDMWKAYDRADWTFLKHILMGIGITGSLPVLIMSTAFFSVMVNGIPMGFFYEERGIRQGCPLSPYLFILISQGLSWLILERANLYNGYRINKYTPAVSHLYACR